MKKSVVYLLICLGILFSENLLAQHRMLSGIVSDPQGLPLTGVNIAVQGTTNGVISDMDGKYAINVAKEETLNFTYIGYLPVAVKVGTSTTINVTLQENITALQEVVAIGYGTLKSSQVTSSITKLGSESLEDRPVARIDQAIQGKMAGVYVQEVSGSPGKAMSVKVRGTGSINYGTAPLYVVDGFPISGDLNSISPADIESIEVLKDAASAAIYGSRGANGVVLITTRTGKKGKISIDLDVSFGFQKRFSKVDVLNRDEYIEYAIEERTNTYKYIGGNPNIPEDQRTPPHQYAIDPLWRSNPSSFPDNDWQDLISRTAPVQNYSLAVSGGSDKVKYFISGNYMDQQGILLNTDYNRLAFRSNVEVEANKYFTFGLNILGSMSDRNDPDTDSNQGPVSRSIVMAPIVGIDQQNVNGGMYYYHAGFFLNPITLLEEVENVSKNSELLSNVYANFNILDNLVLRSTFGMNLINGRGQYFKTLNINRSNPSFGTESSSYRKNYLTENTLNYNLEKEKWALNLLGGYTYQREYYEESSLSKSGYPDDDIKTLNAATKLDSGSSSAEEWSLISYLARANFSYLNRYMLTASIRHDGSSRFGNKNRWGTFPSVSGGWVVSNENFMQAVSGKISNLKLRASYGVVGSNNIGNYSATGIMSGGNYTFNNTPVGGYLPGNFSNADLGWEKTLTTDVGVDIGFINNRLNVSLDYYLANTRDLLLNVPIPQITGFSSALQNIGKIQNTGVELELLSKNLTGEFKWSTNFNISYNKNEVKQLGLDGSPIYGSNSGFIITKTEIGEPVGYYYLYKTDGLFKDEEDCIKNKTMSFANKNPQPGDVKYKDMDGNGIIDENDKTKVGKNNPDFTWGVTNTFSYKGFDLSVFIDGVFECQLINMAKKETTQSRGNVRGYWRDRWRSVENPGNGIVPRACTTDNLTTPSDWWLESGKFWRIRNINLAYSLPKSVINKIPQISGLRIYATVDNVYMHDNYNHMAQNAPISNSSLTPGVDYDSGYPLARTFQFGVNIKF